MQIVYKSIESVTLCDKSGNIFKLPVESFIEYDDDIRITSSFRSASLLFRGWVGDLTYKTTDGIELKSGNKTTAVEETFHDVLLQSILLTMVDYEGLCIWEYVFLKK